MGDQASSVAPGTAETRRHTGSAFSGVRWNTAGRLTLQAMRYAVFLVLARLLSPADFGLFAVATVAVGFLELLRDLGTGQAIIQRRELSEDLLSSVFYLNAMLGLVVAAAFVLAGQTIARMYGLGDELAAILRLVGLGFLLSAVGGVQRALLARDVRFGELAIADVGAAVSNGVVAIGLAYAGFGVWSLAWGSIANALTGTAVVWAVVRWRPRLRFAPSELREIASYSIPLTGANLVAYFLVNMDSLIISRTLGPAAMGFYSIAQRLAVLPIRTVTEAVQSVLIPALARQQDDLAGLQRDFLRAVAGVALVSFPIAAGIAVVAPPFVEAVMGEQWALAGPLTTLLAPAAALLAPELMALSIFYAVGRTDLLFWWVVGSSLTFVAGYAIGVLWGLEGVILGFGATVVVTFYPAFATTLRLIELPFRSILSALGPCAAYALAMTAIAWLTRFGLEHLGAPPVVVLVATSLTGAAFYAGLLWQTRPPAMTDLLRLIRVRT